MTAIGIDTYKATLAACAVDELGQPLDEREFANDPATGRCCPGPSDSRLCGSGSRARPAPAAAAARFWSLPGARSGRSHRSSVIVSGSGPGGPARATPVMPWRSPG